MERVYAVLLGLSLAWGLQLTIGLGWIMSFFPLPQIAQASGFFPANISSVLPERDVLYYRVFVLTSIAFFAALFTMTQQRRDDKEAMAFWKRLMITELLMTVLLVSAIFKMWIYPKPQLAQGVLKVLLVVSIVSKVFWPEINRLLIKGLSWVFDDARCSVLVRIGGPAFMLLIGFTIWVPDYQAAVARMFIGEQFHHTNAFVMAPGWSHISGNTLNVDTTSRYGIGVAVIISEIANRLGGFSYESVFCVIAAGVVLYYLGWYLLFRRWFHSLAWAMIGVLTGIRLQLFGREVFPFVFTYPNVSPIRCVWDIVFFIFIYLFIARQQRRWLWLAAAICGLAIFHVTGDGLYLTAAFLGGLFVYAVVPVLRQSLLSMVTWPQLAGLCAFPFGVAFLLHAWQAGTAAFTLKFWNNLLEWVISYSNGFGASPMAGGLMSHNFVENWIGLCLPIFYLATLLMAIVGIQQKKFSQRHLLLVFMTLYAFAAYHYYAALSYNASYWRNGIVFAFMVCWWGQWVVNRYFLKSSVKIKFIAIAVVSYALVTNHNFIAYPNVFNISRNPITDPLVTQIPEGRTNYFNHLFSSYPDAFKLPLNSLGETDEMLLTELDLPTHDALKKFYVQEINFAKDASLIQGLTGPQEKVALISSFETAILIQAKRRPFFYIFELINSRPRRMRIFVVTHMFTTKHLARTIKQLEEEKPPFVFMERIFMTESIPKAYFYDSADFVPLLQYVRQYYEPFRDGEFLVAMKRKN